MRIARQLRVYSLRTLLALAALFAVGLASVRYESEQLVRIRETIARVESLGGSVYTANTLRKLGVGQYYKSSGRIPWHRRLLLGETELDRPRVVALTRGFGDENLAELRNLGTLDYVLLNDAVVSDDAVRQLGMELPGCTITKEHLP